MPSSFSNITHPGYKPLPPATVGQRDLAKLEFLARDNIAIANFLSTFTTAGEATVNLLRTSRETRDLIVKDLDNPHSQAEISAMATQLNTLSGQDNAQLQFILDMNRSMAMAYQHLVPNLISTLSQLALTRRDAYIKHANNNLDPSRKKELRTNSLLGQDMFDGAKIQQYEKHLIEVSSRGSSSSSGRGRFQPYPKQSGQKKKSRGRGRSYQQPTYAPVAMTQPQFVVPQPFYPPQQQQGGSFRGSSRGRGHRRGRGRGAGPSTSGTQQ